MGDLIIISPKHPAPRSSNQLVVVVLLPASHTSDIRQDGRKRRDVVDGKNRDLYNLSPTLQLFRSSRNELDGQACLRAALHTAEQINFAAIQQKRNCFQQYVGARPIRRPSSMQNKSGQNVAGRGGDLVDYAPSSLTLKKTSLEL